MRIKNIFIVLALLVISLSTLRAQEKPTDGEKAAQNKEAIDVTKTKEFQNAVEEKVREDVKKWMVRIQQGKLTSYVSELMDKEKEIKLREVQLSQKEESFKLNQSDFHKQVQKFQARQANFLTCLDESEEQKEKRIGHMVEVISGMKPLKAADILSVQDSEISIKILARLDPVKVSKIFNLMKKEISARLQKQYMTMKK